jgi:transposase
MRWIRNVNYDQAALIPGDMRSWLPEGHVSWRMLEVTGEMDLSAFYAAYRQDGQGQAPYDPGMMLALVCYCLYKGIRSSRKIAAACADDVGARLICGGPGPSHKTVAEFRKRHRAAITGLFAQVLGIMAAGDAIEGRSCAVDGSPVSGNASRFGNMTSEQLETRIAALEEKLAAATAGWLDGAGTQPALDDDDHGDGDDDDDGPPAGMPRRISLMMAKLARLHAARERLAARAAAPGGAGAQAAAAREKAEKLQAELDKAEAAQDKLVARHEAALAAGKKGHRGKAPVPKDKNARICLQRERARSAWERARATAGKAAVLIAEKLKVNPADPDTRLLPAKNGGGWLQGWNLELGAARRQVLLAVELHDSPADVEALVPVIRASMANIAEAARRPGAASLRGLVRAWLADSGYASAANFAELEELLLLVAVTSEGAQAGRRDGGRDTPEAWKPMEARLATPAGKALYKRRAAYVEPAFAQYFARFGRHFHYRGRDAVNAEAKLLGTVHNLAKLFAHRDRTARQAARTRAAPAPA